MLVHISPLCNGVRSVVTLSEKKTVVALTLKLILYTSVTLRKLDCNPLDFFIQHMTTLFYSWSCGHCPVLSNVRPEDVASNIRMATQLHPMISSAAMVIFSPYRDFNAPAGSEKIVKEPHQIVFGKIGRPFSVIPQPSAINCYKGF
ncbi:predicted protein [Arabidopsis lyrata subsp. lyrata]|uniref:Predicted protein n=1 Tax=Arabidopsis lyrata subsp. lyrata TaxID=81972 RepID=D7L4D2_ARALL|nr:predicted protein [Arabidopsis lyrata subsp. lyrata]